jgi:glycosyltransferase involved in cell wall biosynthesis
MQASHSGVPTVAPPVEPDELRHTISVSVVIPAKNEAANLPHVLPRIPTWVHEVILVDGDSTDGTADVARRTRPHIRIIDQQGKGKGAALRTGFAAATGEIIVMLDADGSMAPEEIPAYIGLLLAGADLVKGSRFVQGGGTSDMPAYRKLGNGFFVACVRLLFGSRYSDLCYGYTAFWRRVLPLLELDGNGFEIETMINVRALRAGLKVAEVPSFEARRIYGASNLQTLPDGWRVLKTILKERWKESARRRRARQSPIVSGMAHVPYEPALLDD